MHVFLIAAVSVDGFIDRGSHQSSTEWTSAEDKKFFRDRTKEAGVMIVGRTTFETIGRALPGRKIYVLSSQPKPEKYAAIPDTEVEYTSLKPAELLEKLKTEQLPKSAAELQSTSPTDQVVRPVITSKPITEVAICGGSSIYAQFMQAGLINTLYLTMESVVFGEGIKLFSGSLQNQLSLSSVSKLSDQTVLLEYSVVS